MYLAKGVGLAKGRPNGAKRVTTRNLVNAFLEECHQGGSCRLEPKLHTAHAWAAAGLSPNDKTQIQFPQGTDGWECTLTRSRGLPGVGTGCECEGGDAEVAVQRNPTKNKNSVSGK